MLMTGPLGQYLYDLCDLWSQTCIAKNTVISPNFLVWKFYGKAQFPQNFHTRKSGEIVVFFAVFDMF